jgi:hypothetical protein
MHSNAESNAFSANVSFTGLRDLARHPFPILCCRLSRCMRKSSERHKDTLAYHPRSEDSGIE